MGMLATSDSQKPTSDGVSRGPLREKTGQTHRWALAAVKDSKWKRLQLHPNHLSMSPSVLDSNVYYQCSMGHTDGWLLPNVLETADLRLVIL